MTTNIFELPKSSRPPPKILAHLDTFPATYLDPQHPPKVKQPWKALHDLQLIKTVSLTVPKAFYDDLELQRVFNPSPKPALPSHGTPSSTQTLPTPSQRRSHAQFSSTKYAKFIAPLSSILEHTTLRRGSYAFISEGYPHSNDTLITLINGTLTLTLPRSVHERSGLPFNAWKLPGAAGGRKHAESSARWRMQIDLREPSMVKGRKGFDRLLWAAERVEGLSEARTWLFCRADADVSGARNGNEPLDEGKEDWIPEEIQALHPAIIDDPVRITILKDAFLPSFLGHNVKDSLHEILSIPIDSNSIRTDEDIYEVIEYFNLLAIASPRVLNGSGSFERVDPYLCSYRLPELGSAVSNVESVERAETTDLLTLKWRGMISSDWVVRLLMLVLKQARRKIDAQGREKGDGWCWLSVMAHRVEAVGQTDGASVLLQTARGTMGDEMEGTTETEGGQPMDVDEEDKTREITDELDEPVGQEHGIGFRYFSCFQFIDS